METSYSVAVDYNKTVKQLVEAGKHDWVNDDITDGNFPSGEEGKVQLEIFLMSFERHTSSEDAIKLMDEQGLRPITLKELLALGSDYSGLQREDLIVALGSTWRNSHGDLEVPYLYRYASEHHLDLNWFKGDWGVSDWRFAVVHK